LIQSWEDNVENELKSIEIENLIENRENFGIKMECEKFSRE
jgi:hypothetical protein